MDFFKGVDGSLVDRIMEKLDNNIETSFYLRFSYTYSLKNFETGAIILYHKNKKGSPWLQYLEAPDGEEIQPQTARAWLSAEEESQETCRIGCPP